MNETEGKILMTRLDRFCNRLKRGILSKPSPFALRYAASHGDTDFADREGLSYRDIAVGDRWGERWELGWFHLRLENLEAFNSGEVVARIDLGGEGLVFDNQGTILQGISSGSVFDSDFSRDLVHLRPLSTDTKRLELWVEASACGLFGIHTEPDPRPDSPRRYGHFEAKVAAAELCSFDRDLWALWLDVESAKGMLSVWAQTSTRRARVLRQAGQVVDAFERGLSVSECRDMLATELNQPASRSELGVTAVGHAHIDTAWLWPVDETVRKCARSFASQIGLLDRYDDYVFGASQPQHYQFVKERYPELYKRVCNAVSNGRWELQGGMWVEADCNLISGESMVRQILHGKNFYRDEFGQDVTNLWLPDVFGYSPAIPQILLKSGIKYFLTQKMSWSQYNKFPHHTFLWEGIDGSSVLAHFPPEDNYNSSLRPESLVRGADQFAERGYVERFLSLFGVGDGGGGPKEEHIEFGRRGSNCEGIPKIQFGTADGFFESLEKHRSDLQRWVGELYLELHRGTLTTQARNKRWNRKLEYQLLNTEMLWSVLPLDKYPTEELDTLWKQLLKNQFHDILPGSSITEVYRRTESEYRELEDRTNHLESQATEQLFEKDKSSLVAFNPSSYAFEGDIALPNSWVSISNEDGAMPSQQEPDGATARVTLPPLQFVTFAGQSLPAAEVVSDSVPVLENDLIRYEFETDGRLSVMHDKESGRTVSIPDCPGNLLTLYEDRPNDWDAWDIDRTYENTAIENQQNAEPLTRRMGPVRQWLETGVQIGQSSVTQKIVLRPDSRQLDFETKVDWQESHKMLRVSFPVDIHTAEATFDVQYGYIRRPTHRNTSWDLARFEVVGHRYADLSEPDYGVALLNDCKYGYKVLGNTLELNLLRSPSYPDPDADRGRHTFTYSLLPHCGDLVHSDVMACATHLNRPPLVFAGYKTSGIRFPVNLDGDGVVIEVAKKAEKENTLILRLIETKGGQSRANLRLNRPARSISECNLMEWQDLVELDLSEEIAIEMMPFEIRTFKIKWD